MSQQVHVGDVGTVFRVTLSKQDGTPLDISTATTLNFLLGPPTGPTKTFAGSMTNTGTDGVCQYATAAPSDIDAAGIWKLQVYVSTPSWSGHSDVTKFKAIANIG